MDKTLLYIGGAVALVGGYILYENSQTPAAAAAATPATAAPGTAPASLASLAVPGAPAAPASYNDQYYKTYQYPAILAAYPQVGNPNYVLTPTDAQNYLNNYLELQQWVPTVVGSGKKYSNAQAALQWHWKTYGVPYQYSFIPFTPPKNANYVPAPAVAKSSGSSSTFDDILKGVGTAVTVVASLAGPGDGLNDTQLVLLLNGGGVLKNILPLYANDDRQHVMAIEQAFDSVINGYF